ncbi:MAG: hydantoinase/oxoprolinase family protein, partial [Thermodesulfobacteriota bacterium]
VLKDYSQTVMISGEGMDYENISRCFRPLEEQAVREMNLQGFNVDDIELDYLLDMRYQGQSFEIMVPFTDNFREDFSSLHEQEYGRCYPDKPLEIVNIRLRSRGVPEKPELLPSVKQEEKIPAKAFLEDREVIFANKKHNTPFLDRKELLSGNKLDGPAVIVEYSSTVVVPHFASFYVDKFRNLILNTA